MRNPIPHPNPLPEGEGANEKTNPDSPGEFAGDSFTGQGGSYMLDPQTGIRTRVEAPTQGAVRPADTMPPRTTSTSDGNAPDTPASPAPRRTRTTALPVKGRPVDAPLLHSDPTALVTHIEEVAK